MPSSTRIVIRGVKELRKGIQAVNNRLERRLYNFALRPAAKILLTTMRYLVRRGATGNLARSLRIRDITERGRFLKMAVGAGQSKTHPGYHAILIERGVKPHGPIVAGTYRGRPTGKKVLSNGTRVFGRRVNHPGHRAYPFVAPALALSKERMLTVIADNIGTEVSLGIKSGR